MKITIKNYLLEITFSNPIKHEYINLLSLMWGVDYIRLTLFNFEIMLEVE